MVVQPSSVVSIAMGNTFSAAVKRALFPDWSEDSPFRISQSRTALGLDDDKNGPAAAGKSNKSRQMAGSRGRGQGGVRVPVGGHRLAVGGGGPGWQ